MNELAKLKGKEFDDRFMEVMAKDHEQMEGMFKEAADKGQDPDVKAFAEKNLPTIKAHKEHAKQPEKKLE
jgi:putative membrane protein